MIEPHQHADDEDCVEPEHPAETECRDHPHEH